MHGIGALFAAPRCPCSRPLYGRHGQHVAGAFRSIGVSSSAYWLSYWAQAFVLTIIASVLVYLGGLALILFSVVLNNLIDSFPTILFILAPLAYYRAIHLLVERPYSLNHLAGEMRTIFLLLTFDAIIYVALAAYLDAVMPREFGVTQPPLLPTAIQALCAAPWVDAGKPHQEASKCA